MTSGLLLFPRLPHIQPPIVWWCAADALVHAEGLVNAFSGPGNFTTRLHPQPASSRLGSDQPTATSSASCVTPFGLDHVEKYRVSVEGDRRPNTHDSPCDSKS